MNFLDKIYLKEMDYVFDRLRGKKFLSFEGKSIVESIYEIRKNPDSFNRIKAKKILKDINVSEELNSKPGKLLGIYFIYIFAMLVLSIIFPLNIENSVVIVLIGALLLTPAGYFLFRLKIPIIQRFILKYVYLLNTMAIIIMFLISYFIYRLPQSEIYKQASMVVLPALLYIADRYDNHNYEALKAERERFVFTELNPYYDGSEDEKLEKENREIEDSIAAAEDMKRESEHDNDYY